METRREVLELLLRDARSSSDEIARQLDVDPTTIDDIISDLEAENVIRGYQAIIDWSETPYSYVEAEVELNVELDRDTSYRDIAKRIAEYDEVSSLRLVSGEYDFVADLEGESMRALSDFIAEQIAPIPEVTQTVTHFVMETYKDRGIVIDTDDDDERLSVSP
jgi:DNA-binding Lrp family transcriptional regulator